VFIVDEVNPNEGGPNLKENLAYRVTFIVEEP
jgi:hypothetical protein